MTDPVVVRAGLDGAVDLALPPSSTLQQTVTVTAPAFSVPDEVKSSAFLDQPGQHPQERQRAAGCLTLRPDPPRRRHRHQRFPQRHHRPRRQPARESLHRRQRRDPEHQRLRQLRLCWRHGEHPRRRAHRGRDVPHGRVSGPVHQPHVERVADCAARGPPRRLPWLDDTRFRRRGDDSGRTDRRQPDRPGEGILDRVGAPELSRFLHRRHRHRRRAGPLHAERQGRLRRHGPRSRVDGERLGRRRDPPGCA